MVLKEIDAKVTKDVIEVETNKQKKIQKKKCIEMNEWNINRN